VRGTAPLNNHCYNARSFHAQSKRPDLDPLKSLFTHVRSFNLSAKQRPFMIHYHHSIENLSWENLSALFQSVGWGPRTASELLAAFSRSSHVILAYDQNQLVGCGRTVDDGKYYCLIVDVIVAPTHQRRGIGTHIVQYLKQQSKDYLFCTLTAAADKAPFYETLGFRKQQTAYILPPTQKQASDHC
jgi:N-acetylglutamate synthase-like GNAT family acetyltransferase